jgi:hypothetical protein
VVLRSDVGHLQTFPKPKDMAALPSKAEIGGVTDSQAPEHIAQGCEPLLRPEMSRRRATASAEYRPSLNGYYWSCPWGGYYGGSW